MSRNKGDAGKRFQVLQYVPVRCIYHAQDTLLYEVHNFVQK